jgi:cytochrome c peroxidase
MHRNLWSALFGMACLITVGCTAPPAGQPSANPPPAAVVSPVPAMPGATSQASSPSAALVQVPLGLSADLHVPSDNPLTPEKIELGRMLYFDKRLSADGTVSCATCHDPQKGWTDNLPVSNGIRGQKGTRNAPSVINSTYSPLQFWDGRAKTLEEQALGPIANPVEMGATHEAMVTSLKGIKGYQPLFEKAFGGPATKERVGMALAAFERTVLSGNSRYDRFQAGDKKALNESETRGLALFFGKARCVLCHSAPTFSDGRFHNLGVGMDKPKPDLGRFVVTKQDADRGAFKTSMLRDLTHTAPYMHDGSEKDLATVVEFYDRGGQANPQLDRLMVPLHLTIVEKADLVAFLKALDGDPTPTAESPKLPD